MMFVLFGIITISGCKEDKENEYIGITGIEVDQTELFLSPGNTHQVTATVKPDNASDKTVEWKSANEAVATVSNTGTITAVSSGSTTVSVTSTANRAIKADITVNVLGILLNQTDIRMVPGGTFQLTATTVPESNIQFKYSSSNEGIASVNNSGLISAKAEGTAVITVAAATDSNLKAEASVTVTRSGEIALDPSSDRIIVVADLTNSPYNAYGDIGYSRRKSTGEKTWHDGSEPGVDLVNAFVTHIVVHYWTSGLSITDETRNILDIADEYGLKVFVPVRNGRISSIVQDGVAEQVSALKNHPALDGWNLYDEPNAEVFGDLATLQNIVQSADNSSEHPTFINLLPNYASGLTTPINYRNYVHNFLEAVNPPVLSFDHYPITGSNHAVRDYYYENLEIIADEARQKGIPFWGYILTAGHLIYPEPVIEDLRLQAFSNLAYGAQAILYFNWWNGDAVFTPAVFDYNTGNKTSVYPRMVTLGEEIKNLSRVFKGATVLKVMHQAYAIPRSTTAFNASELPSAIKSLQFATRYSSALVSLMEKGDKEYLVIVNSSATDDLGLSIEVGATVREITKHNTAIWGVTGVQEKTVEPGDILIYEWDKEN
jgi:hypothetical protein